MEDRIMKAKTMIAALGIGHGLACAWMALTAFAAVCSGAQYGIGGVLTAAVTVAAIAVGICSTARVIRALGIAYRVLKDKEGLIKAIDSMEKMQDEQEAV